MSLPNGQTVSDRPCLLTFGEADSLDPSGLHVDGIRELLQQQGIPTFGHGEMRVVVPSELTVWMPQHLMGADWQLEPLRRQYVEAIGTLQSGDAVFQQYVPHVGAYALFAAPKDVELFKVYFPGMDIYCQHSALLTPALLKRSANHPIVLLHVRERSFDVEALWNGQLLLSNSYAIKEQSADTSSQEELLYQAINVMKQLRLETPDMELAICGAVDRALYTKLQPFFPNVTLYTGQPLTFAHPDMQTLPIYRYVLAV